MDADQPITGQDQDRFGRTPLAGAIAADLDAGAVSGGVVAALVGPWGSGKTSVLNLVTTRLRDTEHTIVIEFNPWFFSGTQQLVEHFLAELAGQLASQNDRRLQAIAAQLDAYRQILEPVGMVPVVGRFATIGAAAGALGSAIAKKKARFGSTNVQTERRAVERALASSEHRFVVVVDDIDRLQPDEVRDIVRLVRLVADFPRISYLLAFDRGRVERVLGDGDADLGRDYLEKIVQVLYLLPPPTRGQLVRFAFETVDRSIGGLEARDLDERYWGNVSTFVVQPLIRTPRDAKRYANALPSTIRAIGREVNLVDLLALEAVRVLLPQTFDKLPRLAEALTYVDSGYVGGVDRLASKRDAFRTELASLVKEAGERGPAVEQLLRWVFPGSQSFTGNTHYGPEWAHSWRRERRVANAEVFAIYLARSIPDGAVPTAFVDLVAGGLSDAHVLGVAFDALPDDQVEPMLDRLEDFEEEFPHNPLEALVAIANLRPRLRVGRAGFFDLGGEMRVDRLVLRLLRRIEPEQGRDDVARAAYGRISALSGRLWLLLVAGHRENVGHGLVSEQVERELATQLRRDIRDATVRQLATERDLVRLLELLHESADSGDQAALRSLLDQDDVVVGLLRSSLSETQSLTIGEVTVQRENALPWTWLEKLIAPDDLGQRVRRTQIPDTFGSDQRAADALATARRYADGWRPDATERMRVGAADRGDGTTSSDGMNASGTEDAHQIDPPDEPEAR